MAWLGWLRLGAYAANAFAVVRRFSERAGANIITSRRAIGSPHACQAAAAAAALLARANHGRLRRAARLAVAATVGTIRSARETRRARAAAAPPRPRPHLVVYVVSSLSVSRLRLLPFALPPPLCLSLLSCRSLPLSLARSLCRVTADGAGKTGRTRRYARPDAARYVCPSHGLGRAAIMPYRA